MQIKSMIKKIQRILNCPVFLSHKEITTRKKAKKDWERIQCLISKLEATQKQLRMYKEFWDSSRDAFLLVQCPDGSIIDANPAACSLYGYEHACVADLNLADISAEHESTKTVFANRLTYIPIRIHKNSDGRKILVTATVSYFIDKTGVEIAACTIRPIINQQVTGGIINDIMLDIAEFQQNA